MAALVMQSLVNLGVMKTATMPEDEAGWDPDKYSNSSSMYTNTDAIDSGTLDDFRTFKHSDKAQEYPKLEIDPEGAWAPQVQPVQFLQVDPVMSEDVLYPNYQYTHWRDVNSAQAAEGELECEHQFPGKVIDKSSIGSKELMGLNMAQETVLPAGAGSEASPYYAPLPIGAIAPTMGINYQSTLTYMDSANADAYNQNFVSLSAVPAVHVGTWKDAYTGVEYDAYESAMPPPDADYVEISHSSAKNVALGLLQGGGAGFSNDTPHPERRELLDDEFHYHANVPINTYGAADGGAWADALQAQAYYQAERNMRFTHDDERPDGLDGKELLDQLPANRDGRYNEKVRFVPRLQHTNRGKREELTFRSGAGPPPQGMQEHHTAQIYTHFPQQLPDIERQGGPANLFQGVEASAQYAEVMDTTVPQREETQLDAGHVSSTMGASTTSHGFFGTVFPQAARSGEHEMTFTQRGLTTSTHDAVTANVGAVYSEGGGAQALGLGGQKPTRSRRIEFLSRLAGISKSGADSTMATAEASRETVVYLKDDKGYLTDYVGGRQPYENNSMEGALPGLVQHKNKHRPTQEYYGNPSEYATNIMGRLDPSTQLKEDYNPETVRMPNMEIPHYVGVAAAQAFIEFEPQPCPLIF